MEFSSGQINTRYQPVTVDVPEERVAEFHALFARFLAGGPGRGRSGRGHGGPHGRHHGRRCGGRHGAAEHAEASTRSSDTSEV